MDLGRFHSPGALSAPSFSYCLAVETPSPANRKHKVSVRHPRKTKGVPRLRDDVTNLFYRIPSEFRSRKIPDWYHSYVNVPKYIFRVIGRGMSPRQKIISTLCRLYNLYRFGLCRGTSRTSWLIKSGRGDSIHPLLVNLYTNRWYTMASIAYRRLKVLLRPLYGPRAI